MVQYFEKIDVYVLSDSSGILPPYSVWNTSITEIPESIQLAYRKEIPIWSELIGFARSLNTINGLIMRINHLMEFEDIETRDNTTAMGVINQMRDIITHFSKLIPEQLTVVDNYGRITSAKVDSKQDVSIVDYTTGNETAPIEKENAWIKVEVDGDPVAPLISITHTTNESYDNSGSSEDLNNSKATEINLFTPKVDNAGHIVGSNTNTITLPSGYQTFKDSNDPIGISTASTPYDTITLIGDNWINPIVSKDTITLNHLNPVITEFVQKPNETPQFGSTFIIDDYYYDDNGHKFAESSHTIQIPKVSLIDNASNEADVITKLILVPETGTFTSVRTNIGDLKLTGYTLPTAISGTISAEDTLNIALGKLKFELDKEIADRTTAISTGIGALDVEDSAVNSQYVSSVSEVDGKINVVRESATNLVLTGYTTTTDITEISATDTIGRAFSLLQNQILNFNNRIKALEDAGYITNASLVDYAKSTDVISKVIYEQKITELEEKITKLEEALAINHPVTEEPETPPI